jgi:hypothetical protein
MDCRRDGCTPESDLVVGYFTAEYARSTSIMLVDRLFYVFLPTGI